MLIAVINESTLVSNADCQTMCAAIQEQMNLHVAPAWNSKPATIIFYADKTKVPGYAWVVNMIDNDAQVQGALGFHEEVSDKVVAYIMAQPILSNGGTVLNFDSKNPGAYTVSGTLSHEIIEMFGDRYTNCYFDNGNVSWCAELCDPVEQIGYGIMVDGKNVSVSDFCFPSFFNPSATLALNAPFNYLNTVKVPFSILPGGYAIQRTGGPGTETQITGELMPQWRKDIKQSEFSRFKRIISR
jgi:hypothetical protein